MARITYDLPEGTPEPGDVMVTTAGTMYAILAVREVRTREPHPFHRWALTVERILGYDGAGRLWPIRWYRRGERPA